MSVISTECTSKINKTIHNSKSITFHRDVGLNINLADWWRVDDLGHFQADG